MELLSRVIRYLVAGLFIFSGLIKLNDPLGTAYKLEEYFHVFSSEISPAFSFFIPHCLSLSVILSAFEVILGVAIFINYKMKMTTWVSLVLIAFFTFLTFYAWYSGTMKECGCFGDFIKLKAGQSFIKDLILLLMIAFLFIKRKEFSPVLSSLRSNALIISVTVLSFFTGYYAINHLPYFDFLPFARGKSIPQQQKAEEAPKFVYIMSKEGKQYTFDHYPLEKGFTLDTSYISNPETAYPRIGDYQFFDENGSDYADSSLKGKVLLIVVKNVFQASEYSDLDGKMTAMFQLINESEKNNIKVMVLTSSNPGDFEDFRHKVRLAAPFYLTDETLLKTMIRANIGIIALQEGTVKAKWHYNDIPSFSRLQSLL